jgi:hypothetical protein
MIGTKQIGYGSNGENKKMTNQAQTNEADETKMRGHHTLTKLPPPPREIGVVNINGENLKNNSNA